jgi:hypothetical protein
MAVIISDSLTGADQFTDSAYLEGYFNLSITGTFSATVTVQRSFDKGSSWHDVDTFTSTAEEVGFEPETVKYRVGIKSGEYTSGTATVRIGHEDNETH